MKQANEALFTLRGSKIPLLLQENFSKQQLNTTQTHFQKTFYSPTSKGNLTTRDLFHIEPLKIERIQQSKLKGDRSHSVIKTKILEDSKIKGLLNLIQDRNKKTLIGDTPKLTFSPYKIQNFNLTSQKLNFKRISMKSKMNEEQDKKFLIHTFRKNSNYQNQNYDISRPVRSKSDVERTRSKSNLKIQNPQACDESQKKKNVRFNERVEIRMFDLSRKFEIE